MYIHYWTLWAFTFNRLWRLTKLTKYAHSWRNIHNDTDYSKLQHKNNVIFLRHLTQRGWLTDLWPSLLGWVWSHPRPVDCGSWQQWRFGRALHCTAVAWALETRQEDSALSVQDCQGCGVQTRVQKWWTTNSEVDIVFYVR